MKEENPIPKAPKYPKTLEKHGHLREDPYYWMNDREHPDILPYLQAENKYFETDTKDCENLRSTLYTEMRARIKEDDNSLPTFKRGYWYRSEYEKGKEYPVYVRFANKDRSDRVVLFDVNQMAEPYSYYHFKGLQVSPNNHIALFAEDTVSRRQYTLRFKDLETNLFLEDCIENTTGGACWAADSKTVYYVKKDPKTLRSYQVFRHVLGTPTTDDVLVFQEDDDTFNVGVFTTKSEQFVFIVSSSTLTTEYRFIPSNDPLASFSVLSERQRGLEYSVDHYKDHFYLLTNKDQATNFKLMRTPIAQTGVEHWVDFVPHRKTILLEDIEFFDSYYVLSEREQGLTRLLIHSWDTEESYQVPLSGETYVCSIDDNPEFDTHKLRYYFNSMTEPASIFEINMASKEILRLKQQEVLGGYTGDAYTSFRIWADSKDGVKIPISIVKRKNTPNNAPTLVYGYGAYGHVVDPYFSSTRLSLLDRGFVFAIAHVRGGEYLGRDWYENGKLSKKNNSFIDFIDAAKALVNHNIADKNELYAMGGSAGGLLVGAVINMEPSLFKGVIAAVPFVDVVTTMLDEDIPLTTGEYDEWGNPNLEDDYKRMLSYSPYDNVTLRAYPNLYVSTGFHDSQVQYWEPAKWVAKLRDFHTGDQKIYLDVNLDTGHGGASGRFEQLKELAKEYGFILSLHNPSLCKV